MASLILTTWDWLPERPRGYLRDLRVRWALEEAGLAYRVESVTSRDRDAGHLARQPFGQVPWLVDGGVSVFESGAILRHLGERSTALRPTDPRRRSAAVQWMFAALNAMEPAIIPWVVLSFAGDDGQSPGARRLIELRDGRLRHLEPVLAAREWLAGSFSAADILMADALRLFDGTDSLESFPACLADVARATARPAFRKAHADQLAHFARAEQPA
jgi:glutathione S-transferase